MTMTSNGLTSKTDQLFYHHTCPVVYVRFYYDKVWADSDRDYWMTAEEAKAYGMVDEVLIKNK